MSKAQSSIKTHLPHTAAALVFGSRSACLRRPRGGGVIKKAIVGVTASCDTGRRFVRTKLTHSHSRKQFSKFDIKSAGRFTTKSQFLSRFKKKKLISCTVWTKHTRRDMTYEVDWALKASYFLTYVLRLGPR